MIKKIHKCVIIQCLILFIVKQNYCMQGLLIYSGEKATVFAIELYNWRWATRPPPWVKGGDVADALHKLLSMLELLGAWRCALSM